MRLSKTPFSKIFYLKMGTGRLALTAQNRVRVEVLFVPGTGFDLVTDLTFKDGHTRIFHVRPTRSAHHLTVSLTVRRSYALVRLVAK